MPLLMPFRMQIVLSSNSTALKSAEISPMGITRVRSPISGECASIALLGFAETLGCDVRCFPWSDLPGLPQRVHAVQRHHLRILQPRSRVEQNNALAGLDPTTLAERAQCREHGRAFRANK